MQKIKMYIKKVFGIKFLKLDKIINFIKKPTVVLFGVLIFILSSLITITDGYQILKGAVNESIRHNQVLYEKLNQLTTETNIKYFQSVLGEPVYINNEQGKKIKEFIFVDNAFFVQTVTDNLDKVLMYSVTIRRGGFYPKVPMQDLWLGKSTFTDSKKVFEWDYKNNGGPDWVVSLIGAHDYFYSEGYYLANPGGYQTLGLSMSLSGFINDKNLDISEMPIDYISPNIFYSFPKEIDYQVSEDNTERFPKEIKKFLENNNNIINTYTIFGPFVTPGDIQSIRGDYPYYLFGPDHNQVRLLDYK